jgi:hypothetical protein
LIPLAVGVPVQFIELLMAVDLLCCLQIQSWLHQAAKVR